MRTAAFNEAWAKITVPGHLVGVGINGILIYVGVRNGGWWHILTVIGALGGLAHSGAIVGKLGQPAHPATKGTTP